MSTHQEVMVTEASYKHKCEFYGRHFKIVHGQKIHTVSCIVITVFLIYPTKSKSIAFTPHLTHHNTGGTAWSGKEIRSKIRGSRNDSS